MDGLHDTNFNVRLVKTIKKYPILYNTEHKDYTNREARETAWIEVGEELRCDPKVLQKKWQNFRTVFVRKLKHKDIGDHENSQYYLNDYLQFLIPHLKNPQWIQTKQGSSINDINSDDENDDADLYDINSYYSLKEGNEATQEINDNQDLIYYDEDIDAIPLNTPQKFERISPEEDDIVSKDDESYEQEQFEMSLHNTFSNRRTKLNTSYASSSTTNYAKRKHVAVVEESDPKKQFLLSLLPDLNEMTNSQLRHFKSNVLLILEEILEDSDT